MKILHWILHESPQSLMKTIFSIFTEVSIIYENLGIYIRENWKIYLGHCVKRYPLTPTTLSQSSNHVFFLAGRWSTSGWGGNAHFFTYTRIRSRETGENKQTNKHEQTWGYQEQREVCNTTCMCIPDSRYGLTLAWVTSENSTMLLESDILRLFFTGPYLVSSPLCSVSGVDCPSVLPRQLLLFASLLSSRNSSLGSSHHSSAGLQPPTPSRVQPPTPLSPLQPPTPSARSQLPSLGRVVNSRSRPLTTSGYGEISCPRILCLVSRQNRLVCFGGLPT